MKNQSLRNKLPVMFICQTNHALDQMLEHIYKFDQVRSSMSIIYWPLGVFPLCRSYLTL